MLWLAKRVLIVLLAAYLLMGPALVQVWGLDSGMHMIRSWQMYNSVGLGAPYGEYRVKENQNVVSKTDLMFAMQIDRVRRLQRYTGSGSLKEKSYHHAIIFAAQNLCKSLSNGQTLIFIGRYAVRNGWQAVTLSHQDLCNHE